MSANQTHIAAQTAPRKDAGTDQAAAANPLKSVWVGASAGTGKTKVLIDRVLRLMLPRAQQDAKSATRPERILCLTFTKTAAAEMSNRIYKRLARWAVMEEAKLAEDLSALIGAPADAVIVREARRLFARARYAGRAENHDHPFVLPVGAETFSGRSGPAAAFRTDG